MDHLGGAIGGKTGRIIGAAAGGVGGAVVGYQMDKQIKELKEETEGSGIDVTEVDNGEAILVNLPDGVTAAAIIRDDEVIFPDAKTLVETDDRLLLFYENSATRKVEQFFRVSADFF